MEYTYDAARYQQIFETQFTWLNGFMRCVRRFGSKNALIDPAADQQITYRQLNETCNALANALHSRGVGKNDLVFYQLPNSVAFALCYIAPQKLGAVNSPGNYNLAAGEVAQILEHHRPRVYVYDSEIRKTAWQALERSSFQPEILLCVDSRGDAPELPDGHEFFDRFYQGADTAEPPAPDVDLYSEVTRLFTSGTTGLPKGIPVNNCNEVLSAHDVIMHFPLSPSDITMNMTPWFHRGGLHSGGLTPTLYVGGACVILRQFHARACLDYCSKYGVSFLIGVPAVLSKLADRQEKHPADLTGLKGIVTMGSPLEKNACIRYQNVLTPNIFNGYGTTETFWNSFLRPADLPAMAGTAGRACTDDEVRVIHMYDDRRAEPDDTVPMDGKTEGEIIILSSAKSAMSYLDNPALTEEKYYKGWLYTHDVGTWDENQFLSICGRKDDMIICMGENIYPAQVEEVIRQHPKVADCLVTGVPDPARGEAVAAYVVPADPSLTVQELNRFCTQSHDLSVYKCPRYYCITDTIPYNSTGKKQHVKAREEAVTDLETGRLHRP